MCLRTALPILCFLGDGVEFGWYDGNNLANEHNVVIVTPNYRLSALGFLAHPALETEDPDKSMGNYGTCAGL